MAKLKKCLKQTYINDIENVPARKIKSMGGELYDKKQPVIQKLTSDSRRSSINGLVRASSIFIHHSNISLKNLEAFPEEIRQLIVAIQDNVPEKYDKDAITKIILSACNIDHADPPAATTIDLKDVENCTSFKISNANLSLYNLLSYLFELKRVVEEIQDDDIVSVIFITISALYKLKINMGRQIEKGAALFLKYLYQTYGYKCVDEDQLIKEFIENSKLINEDSVRGIIRDLEKIKSIVLIDGKIQIIEKIKL